MKRRVQGIETEYAATHRPNQGSLRLSPHDIYTLLYRELIQRGTPRLPDYSVKSDPREHTPFRIHESYEGVNHTHRLTSHITTGSFLPNGSRFYIDVGAHPEICTPECLTAADVVRYEKASERLLEGLAIEAERNLPVQYAGQIHLVKNNTDPGTYEAWGCHDNYLIERRRDKKPAFFDTVTELLVPFLTTRILYCGAGKNYPFKAGPSGKIIEALPLRFQLSQRADFTFVPVSEGTQNFRGLVNTRDEPLSDRERYWRLHIIGGDSNMSEYSTYLKVGLTSMVLTLIEEAPDGLEKLALEDPVKSLRDLSNDPSLTVKLGLRNGTSVAAIEHQRAYLQLALCNKRLFKNQDQQHLLAEWGRVLDGLEQDEPWIGRAVDWKIKQRVETRFLNRAGFSFKDLEPWHPLIQFMKKTQTERVLRTYITERPDDSIYSFMQHCFNPTELTRIQRMGFSIDLQTATVTEFRKARHAYHGVLQEDLTYHDINRERGRFHRLRGIGEIEPVSALIPSLSESFIELAQDQPPSNTRAKARGDAIRAGGYDWADWDELSKGVVHLPLPHPFHTKLQPPWQERVSASYKKAKASWDRYLAKNQSARTLSSNSKSDDDDPCTWDRYSSS